jgi:hypothetical protein
MTEKSKLDEKGRGAGHSIGWWLGWCLRWILVLYLVLSVPKCYVRIGSVGGVFFGGVLGALVGAVIGVIVPQFGKCCRTKAGIGPLPWLAYLSDVGRLRTVYLRITQDKGGNTQKNISIRSRVSLTLFGIVLLVGVVLTYSKEYYSADANIIAPAQKEADPVAIIRPTAASVAGGGNVGQLGMKPLPADEEASPNKPSPLAPVFGNLLVKHFNERGYEYGWSGGAANNGDANRFSFYKVTDIVLDGDHLKIYYDWQHGVLSGTLTGNTFHGNASQDNASDLPPVELVFNRDMTAAKGWWYSAPSGMRFKAMVKTSGH